jgi:hypothetical protein
LTVKKEHKWPDGSVSGRWYVVPRALFRWRLKGKRAGNAAALLKARTATATTGA